MHKIILLICFFILAACTHQKQSIASKPTEKKATTEITAKEITPTEQASIEDTFSRKGTGSAYVFFVSKINGIPTKSNAMTESARASAGKGIYLHALGASRDIPTKPLKVSLTARVVHSAPIVFLADPDAKLKLEGDVEFTPTPNMKYFVKGILNKDQASIWIEDINGNLISKPLGHPMPKTIDSSETQKNGVMPPNSNAAVFANISNGESLDSVIRKLGSPDKISEYKASIFIGPPAHDFTTYEYRSLGKIQFFGVNPKIRTVEKIIPNAPVNDTPETLKTNIDAASPKQLRVLARDYSLTNISDVNYLDIMADKVWDERNNTDSEIEDAVAYLCLTLGRSGNAKYKQFLQSVVDSSKSRKIKKYGKQSLDLLPNENVNPFVPSTL